ncbi:MAG: DUF4783 domain-containing protein [Bacteroidales bacterium]|nr:DUF4783 domain-containing protein [Bacteroidales bacterium]
MKFTSLLLFLLLSLLPPASAQTRQSTSETFSLIEKALKTGDVDAFSQWFSDNLDLDILDASNIYSKNQAKQILKKFFDKYTPKNFTLIHQSGNGRVYYGIGRLIAGGENFRVTIFVQDNDKKLQIQQVRIEVEKN